MPDDHHQGRNQHKLVTGEAVHRDKLDCKVALADICEEYRDRGSLPQDPEGE